MIRAVFRWLAAPSPCGPSLETSDTSQKLRERFSKTLTKFSPDIKFVTDHFGQLGASRLEKLSTAFYFKLKGVTSDSEIAEKLNEVKPQVSVEDGEMAARDVSKIAESI